MLSEAYCASRNSRQMREAIEARFTHCRQKGCLTIYPEPVSYYADPPGEAWVSRVADELYDTERHFRVRNPDGRPVHLAAIDKCLIGRVQPAPKRCDCVFFEDQRRLLRRIQTSLRRASGSRRPEPGNSPTRSRRTIVSQRPAVRGRRYYYGASSGEGIRFCRIRTSISRPNYYTAQHSRIHK